VAEWVFERTPAELKAEMLSRQKKREQREASFVFSFKFKLCCSRGLTGCETF